MPCRWLPAVVFLACCSPLFADGETENSSDAAEIEHFEKKIRPLLVQRCFECHSAESKTLHGNLRLDSAEGLLKGGDTGPAVVPGRPEESLLVDAVVHGQSGLEMPPKGKLPEAEIALLTDWVKRGAVFPGDEQKPLQRQEIDFAAGKQFWSFQPVVRQPLPQVQAAEWPRQRVDWFVLAALERQGLKPSPEADRATLLRRLSFDLIGLPPTPEEIETFVQDTSPDAYEKQVDRLLESPHFGERHGRHWLDLARYTDKTPEWLDGTGQAWRYRDWVVRAINEDLPYDQFVQRQLATDLMPGSNPQDLPALGFLGLAPTYWKELLLPSEIIKVIVADEWEERVDAVSRTFLGLTVACARCHDHKFDPISTEDYYAMAGVFASCRMTERPMITAELFAPVKLARDEVKKLETEMGNLQKQKPVPQDKVDELTKKIAELKMTPQYDAPMANAVSEESLWVVRRGKTPQEGTNLDYKPEPRDLHLFIRGNPNKEGELVPRRFLTVLSNEHSQPFQQGSGRLELARAITEEGGPLAARVIVNRIWMAYFGHGLVTTPSNFGQLGDRPTHPELLDDLTARFLEAGWSMKAVHREIVLSAAYRQSSETASPLATKQQQLDPDNRWLWRMNRKRLEFEPWRDAMLAVSGQLDRQLGGPSVELEDAGNLRRSLYGTVHRREPSAMLTTHDFPDANAHSEQRHTTTTPLQGLFTLNSPLLARQSAALVKRMTDETGDDAGRIHRAYQWLYNRPPTGREVELGLAFLGDPNLPQRASHWQQYAHVLLASNEFLYVD